MPPFPEAELDDLVGHLDAAHATDLIKRRSVSGIAIIYGLAVIAYKSKLQSLTATSSTEAEFYATVEAAKMMLYFRHILEELGMLKGGPSMMYIDNMATINIVNENRPTPRCRHVETQHFALQHWREKGWLKMKHIPGTINAPDALTKGLAHLLHYRHSRRMMGHYKMAIPSTNTPSSTLMASQSSQSGRVVEAGEGVGT